MSDYRRATNFPKTFFYGEFRSRVKKTWRTLARTVEQYYLSGMQNDIFSFFFTFVFCKLFFRNTYKKNAKTKQSFICLT